MKINVAVFHWLRHVHGSFKQPLGLLPLVALMRKNKYLIDLDSFYQTKHYVNSSKNVHKPL